MYNWKHVRIAMGDHCKYFGHCNLTYTYCCLQQGTEIRYRRSTKYPLLGSLGQSRDQACFRVDGELAVMVGKRWFGRLRRPLYARMECDDNMFFEGETPYFAMACCIIAIRKPIS
jgi:hypothetical protein